jgi:MFS-type transporter involved in bile tolerance (Atg22 family)
MLEQWLTQLHIGTHSLYSVVSSCFEFFRRRYLVWCTTLASIFHILQVFVNEETWYLAGIFVIFSTSFGEWGVALALAYIPEIHPEKERSKVSTVALAIGNFGQFVALGIVARKSQKFNINLTFYSVLLSALEPSNLVLKNGSFDSSTASWSVDLNASNSLENLTTVNFESCSSPMCYLSSATIDGTQSIQLDGSNLTEKSGLYQSCGNPLKDLRNREALLVGYVSSSDLGDCELRAYVDSKPFILRDYNAVPVGGFHFFSGTFSTSGSTKELGFELINPAGAISNFDSVNLYSLPTRWVPIFTSIAGVWYFFFGLCSFTHFSPRQQTRGKSNDKRSAWAFIKEVNLNLWQSTKTCASAAKTACWFIGYMFYTSGVTAVVSLAATYLQAQLQFSASFTGVAILVTQLLGIPGAFLFHYLATKTRLGVHSSLGISYALWLLGVVMAYYLWKDQTTPVANVFIVLVIIGLTGGGAVALARTSFADLVPRGREAEFMGLYSFSSKVLSWLGTVMFTAVNESTRSFRNSFLSLASLFLIATIFQFASVFSPRPLFLSSSGSTHIVNSPLSDEL